MIMFHIMEENNKKMIDILKWLEASKILVLRPDEKVKCPVCDYEYLEIKDIIPESDSDMFERMMFCPSCHAVNYLLMKRNNR